MRWRRILITLLSLFLLGCIAWFSGRNSLLRHYADRYAERYERLYQVKIHIGECRFSGLKTLLVNDVSICPAGADSLLHIGRVSADLGLGGLLRGHLRLSNLEVDNAIMKVVKRSDRSNISFLLKNQQAEASADTLPAPGNTDYANLAQAFFNTLFDVVPSSVQFRNITCSLETDSLDIRLNAPSVSIEDQHFSSTFTSTEGDKVIGWKAEGIIDKDGNTARVKLYPTQPQAAFPLLQSKYKLTLSCDTMFLSLERSAFSEGVFSFSGNAYLYNLQANHWRISPKNVIIRECGINYKLSVGSNYFQLDSSTTARLNTIVVHPYIRYTLDKSKQLALQLNMPESQAQDFFASLPTGLFHNLEGIKTEGKLAYRMDFFIDTQEPDSLRFSSSLSKNGFRITGYGATDLRKINGEFSYTAYEKDAAVRTFPVGPSNPNYASLDNISNYLKNAIMTSEDGSFYGHSGFNEAMFRKSIAENYKQKRFVRGGSTISMQLVKNIFLRRNKTIARKIEEALIVWLIENNRLVSKSRMYEVYLNIIELGPNVYGIGEAARFYFNKMPAQLTLEESIFLAMIVPRPKWFKYNFDEQGKLKASAADFYKVIAGHFVKKGLITENDKNALLPEVELTGPARNYIIKKEAETETEQEVPEGYEY